MSLLHTYKDLVSKIYNLTQRAYNGEDTTAQFDDLLNHIAKALEHTATTDQPIHIPPHLEIIHEKSENVIVVKDDNHKNVVVRHTPGIQIDTVIEDEELADEGNVIVSNYPSDEDKEEMDALEAEEMAQMAADEVAEEIAQEAEPETEQEDEEKEEEEKEEEEKEEEEKEEEDDGEEELEPITIKRKKYFVAVESKRIYEYIDESTPGKQVGKLQNGNLITM